MILSSRRIADPRLIDVALTVGLVGLDLLVNWDRSRYTGPLWLVPAVAAVGYVPLVLRRRHPLAVFVWVLTHALVVTAALPAYLPTMAAWAMLYTVARYRSLRWALIALAGAALIAAINLGYALSHLVDPTKRTEIVIASVVGQTLLLSALFGVGRWNRWAGRRHRLTKEAAAKAIAAERSRIARDLHDVVAHSVTLMLLQAGGAARLIRQDPERAEAALRQVDDLGQQALVELKRMLDLLRLDAPPGEQSTSPPTGVDGVRDLVARSSSDGAPVRLTVTGSPRALPPGVDLTGYRIVQEALTNATRYGEPERGVDVGIDWNDRDVVITVDNAVASAGRRVGSGYGLIGMRERALSAGGQLTVGPREDGTFAVRVVLPAPDDPGQGTARAADAAQQFGGTAQRAGNV